MSQASNREAIGSEDLVRPPMVLASGEARVGGVHLAFFKSDGQSVHEFSAGEAKVRQSESQLKAYVKNEITQPDPTVVFGARG